MLPQLPGEKVPYGSATKPRLERFSHQVQNPTHNVGILVGGNPLKHSNIGIVQHFAGGGNYQDDTSYATQGSSADNPQLGPISDDMYQNLGNQMPAGWQTPESVSDNSGMQAPDAGDGGGYSGVPMSQGMGSPAAPQTGFAGWLNNKHGGIDGKTWLKAGLTALTGILSGVAAHHPPKAPANPANSIVPQNYGFSHIGVPSISGSYAQGGQAMANMPPSMPMPQQGPQGAPQGQETQLVQATAMALLGKMPKEQAQKAIRAFVARFGAKALSQLAQEIMNAGQGQGAPQQQQGVMPQQPGMAGGGLLDGPGNGTSDSIPANGGNVRLSDGEYVLDAGTVSALGNGSTKAGAAMLDQGVKRLRQHKFGHTKQPANTKPGMLGIA